MESELLMVSPNFNNKFIDIVIENQYLLNILSRQQFVLLSIFIVMNLYCINFDCCQLALLPTYIVVYAW